MTAYPEALSAHLAREVTTLCHCWRVTRSDGAVSGYTDHDQPLTVEGTLFSPQTGFTASEARDTLGLAVDTVDIEGALASSGIDEADLAAGLYDEARVETLLVNWNSPSDFALLRVASIGKVTRRDHGFVAELVSATYRMDQVRGRTITRACDAELGDARCGFDLDQPGFSGGGSVLSLPGAGLLAVSGIGAFDAGFFSAGMLSWTSGARAGTAERVSAHRVGTEGVTLVLEPSGRPAVEEGDAFTLKAGCDKAFATCKARFANAENFRGFPHLPGNDAAYGYVSDGGVFDGAPLVP